MCVTINLGDAFITTDMIRVTIMGTVRSSLTVLVVIRRTVAHDIIIRWADYCAHQFQVNQIYFTVEIKHLRREVERVTTVYSK